MTEPCVDRSHTSPGRLARRTVDWVHYCTPTGCVCGDHSFLFAAGFGQAHLTVRAFKCTDQQYDLRYRRRWRSERSIDSEFTATRLVLSCCSILRRPRA